MSITHRTHSDLSALDRALSCRANHSTDSRNTSACSSTSTFLTTSSIAILSAPAIAAAPLSSNREKSDELEHRGGRNYLLCSVRPLSLHQP